MRTDEAILDEIIKDGSVEIDEWPELLKRLLQRLDHIAHNSFPQPVIPPPTDISTTSSAPQIPPVLSTESTLVLEPPEPQEANLEATPPPIHSQDVSANTSPKPMPPPPVIPFPDPPPVSDVPKDISPPPGTLHPDDLSLLTNLSRILTTQFDSAPPYTIQRMAELLHNPNKHYRNLSKFLRALQRVLSVSSPVTAFPLPPSAVDTIPNGAFSLGSDESLGGALLSPIPWLMPTALTEDPNTKPSDSEGSTINGVTQGELLRQEQELNIIPTSQVTSSVGHGEELQMGTPPPLGPEDVGPQPEGTVFPDPPRTPEEARSPLPVSSPMAGIDAAMEEVKEETKEEEMKDAEAGASPEKGEKMDEKADEKTEEAGEMKKDDMEVDRKEESKAKEQEDKMQLDAAADEKEEKAQKEGTAAAS